MAAETVEECDSTSLALLLLDDEDDHSLSATLSSPLVSFLALLVPVKLLPSAASSALLLGCICVSLTLLSSAAMLCASYSRHVLHESYSLWMLVAMVELCKCAISGGMALRYESEWARSCTVTHVLRTVRHTLVSSLSSVTHDYLALVALSSVSLPTFAALSQTRILFTTLSAFYVFGRRVSRAQWSAAALVTIGALLVVQSDSSSSGVDGDVLVGFVATVAMAFISGEAALFMQDKPSRAGAGDHDSLRWSQQAQLSFCRTALALLFSSLPSLALQRSAAGQNFATPSFPFHLLSLDGFTAVSWVVVVLLAVGSMLAALTVRHTGSRVQLYIQSASQCIVTGGAVLLLLDGVSASFLSAAAVTIIAVFNYTAVDTVGREESAGGPQTQQTRQHEPSVEDAEGSGRTSDRSSDDEAKCSPSMVSAVALLALSLNLRLFVQLLALLTSFGASIPSSPSPLAAAPVELSHRTSPRLVHFVWSNSANFSLSFYHYAAMVAAARFVRPDGLYLWHPPAAWPTGVWWERAVLDTGVRDRVRELPTSVFGKPINVTAHRSDVMRLHVLLEEGGLYLDTDVVMIQALPDEMWAGGGPGSHGYHHYAGQSPGLPYADVVMGSQMPSSNYLDWTSLCNAVVLAKANATFLNTWFESYRDFRDDDWDFNSVRTPGRLALEAPSSGTVSTLPYTAFYEPLWSDVNPIYVHNTHDFHNAYAMHLWHTAGKYILGNLTPTATQTIQTTLGRVLRHALGGHIMQRLLNDSRLADTAV